MAVAEMTRVCRSSGRIVVIDLTPSAATQAAFDRMEKLRDSSHTRALTPDQLRDLGRSTGPREVLMDRYRL